MYRCDRPTTGGGVAVLVHEQFKSEQITEIFDANCECICVKIELKPIPLIIYAAYVNKPERNIMMKHFSLVQQLVLMEKQSRLLVLGDFNLHDIVWNLDESDTYYIPQNVASHAESEYFQTASDFLDKMHGLPLFQLSNAKNIASNVLDLAFVNGTEDIQACVAPVAITKINESDRFHPPLEISFEYPIGSNKPSTNKTIEVFCYKRGNYDRISQQLNAINFAQLFDQSKKNKRDKLYKNKPKNRTSPEYEKAVKKFNELHDELYSNYINQVQANIVENPAEFWKYARTKKKTSTYPMEMHFNGRKAEQPEEIVELFADYF